MTIEGDSYFDLPLNDDARTPSSLITPMTFMNASSVKTPESQISAERSVEPPAEESASVAEQPGSGGDVILLVEDNAINMRVRLPTAHPISDSRNLTIEHAITVGKTCADHFFSSY